MKSQPAENKKVLGGKEAISATTRETQIARSVESLTDAELNAKVATICGWTEIGWYEDNAGPGFWHGIAPYKLGVDPKGEWEVQRENHSRHLLDYCNSLDAAAEFEKTLSKDVLRYLAYAKLLTETLGAYDAILAAARQRAIAFVTVMEAQKDQDLGEKETK